MTSDSETPYQHFSLRHRVVAWISQRLFDNVTYTVNHGILRGMRRRGGLGWVPQWLAGSGETAEHRFFETLDLRGKVVFDVGAFIGLFSMFSARQARQVICYEPLERTRRRLTENLRLNHIENVTIRPYGVGNTAGVLDMTFDPLMPGGASVSSAIASGIASGPAVVRQRIEIVTLDEDIAAEGLPIPAMIKIDIEGFELDALQGAVQLLQTHHPALYIEMHGETMREKLDKADAIVRFLSQLGYRRILHVESGALVDPDSSHVAANGHLYCTVD